VHFPAALSLVQYDGPSVKIGGKYPTTTRDKFLSWADKDVTDELPADEYATWPIKMVKEQPHD
jgi:hypothetical protein